MPITRATESNPKQLRTTASFDRAILACEEGHAFVRASFLVDQDKISSVRIYQRHWFRWVEMRSVVLDVADGHVFTNHDLLPWKKPSFKAVIGGQTVRYTVPWFFYRGSYHLLRVFRAMVQS